MPISQNGWPGLAGSSRKLYQWRIPTKDGIVKLNLRQGSAGFVLCHLALRFNDETQKLLGGVLDDWGHAYRPVRGYNSKLSNHASGTAIDLNATKHPLGREGTFTNKQEASIARILKQYSGTVKWGGDYRGRKDEMHFEINKSMPHVERVARRLMETKRGKIILDANPTQKAVILS